MIDSSILKTLEPISNLSPNRMQELATLCFREKVSKGINPFRMNVVKSSQALYLLKGKLQLSFNSGAIITISDGSWQAQHPIDSSQLGLKNIIALSDIEILRIDLDLLDIMLTWEQLTTIDIDQKHAALLSSKKKCLEMNSWITGSNAFGISNLQHGIFSRLPPANIDEMFRRVSVVDVIAGQRIIKQGDCGDYYYLIMVGVALVTRLDLNHSSQELAELPPGSAFGEDALISDSKRNATVVMKTDGILLRLSKKDFVELLKAPLIKQISIAQARAAGDSKILVDVRLPSEYKFNHLEGAINIPLNDIRSVLNSLDKEKKYIVYCKTGRRSLAAAFILMQAGFDSVVIQNGA